MAACNVCRDLRVPPFEAPDYGLQIQTAQLVLTATQGCSSCRLLTELMDQMGWTAIDGDELDCYNTTEGAPLGVSLLHPKTRMRQSVELYVTSSDTSPWKCIGTANDIPPRLSLDYCTGIVSKWLSDCARHENCPPTAESPPTRLVAIDASGRSVKLVATAEVSTSDYVALSHRWASQDMVKTTKRNLQQHYLDIPIGALPATFRDAVALVHVLGIGYLWIDSLCIVQDDKADWRQEAARMGEVYMHALFTVAADNALDSSHGLFIASNKRRVCTGRLANNICIRSTGERQLTAVAHTLVPEHGMQAMASPLSSRAWVFQERVLSNRTLHFTEAEMAWECCTELRCECESAATPLNSTSFKSAYVKSQRGNALSLRWLVAVADFTMRSITYPSDRLPALAGLAAITHEDSRGNYAAGLWSSPSQLLHGLLWMSGYIDRLDQLVPADVLHSVRQPATYAPSWSWASVTGCVNSVGNEFDQEQNAIITDARVVEVDCGSDGHDPYIWLSGGHIRLQGAVAGVWLIGRSPDQDPPGQIRHGMRRWEIISDGILRSQYIPDEASWAPRKAPSPFERMAGSDQDQCRIKDEAYLDVDDGAEVDTSMRHYFLLIAYTDYRTDPLRGRRGDFDLLNQDSRPYGLLLRIQEDGTYRRIGLLASRLRREGAAMWKKLATRQGVTIY